MQTRDRGSSTANTRTREQIPRFVTHRQRAVQCVRCVEPSLIRCWLLPIGLSCRTPAGTPTVRKQPSRPWISACPQRIEARARDCSLLVELHCMQRPRAKSHDCPSPPTKTAATAARSWWPQVHAPTGNACEGDAHDGSMVPTVLTR